MNPHYTYFLILACSIAGPLALSFDKKVAFSRSWKYVFAAMIIPAFIYIIWDCWFTARGVWSFNPAYITGSMIFNLPVEEVLFFFIVPYCCLFIYECIRIYFPGLSARNKGWKFFPVLAIVLLILAFIYNGKAYTFVTFLFLALTLLIFFLARKRLSFFNPLVFLISYAVVLLPFLVVNGFLTAIPVVLYDDAENIGLRIYTIPFEDIFYGMLLFLLNVVIFEYLRRRGRLFR